MCVIAAISKNNRLSKETAQICFKANSHGAGFAYIDGEQVKIQKGFKEFEEFWNAFAPLQEANQEAKLVHFRVCSAGVINEVNTHPFAIDAKHAMVHNGTLAAFKAPNATVSDTSLFNHHILRPLFEQFPNFYKTKVGQFVLEETIKTNNKVAILGADGDIVILNESAGEWVGGVWFSNKSYLPPPPAKIKKKHHNFKYPARAGDKRQRISGYISNVDVLDADSQLLVLKNELLTASQLSKMIHYYKKQSGQRKFKVRHLVSRGIVCAKMATV